MNRSKKVIVAVSLILVLSLVTVCAATTWVTIPSAGLTVDTLNGVPAEYRLGNTNTGTYCCARYASNYYLEVYGVHLSGLVTNGTPTLSAEDYDNGFVISEVMEMNGIPLVRQGDLVFYPNRPHSAIVKSVSGDTVTLIEQNWKWVHDGIEQAPFERKISIYQSGVKFYSIFYII